MTEPAAAAEPETISSVWSILTACFAPSLFWLGYWYHRARLGRSSVRLTLIIFAFGLFAGPVALALFEFWGLSTFYEGLEAILETSDTDKFVFAMFAIGPVEETAKFLVVWLAIRAFPRYLDPLNGPAYAAASALGFATVENWWYMLEVEEVVWHRALTLPFVHVLFSSFWGVGMTVARLRPRTGARWLVAGLALSFAYHGLYDYILLSDTLPPWLVVPLMGGLFVWLVVAVTRIRKGLEGI